MKCTIGGYGTRSAGSPSTRIAAASVYVRAVSDSPADPDTMPTEAQSADDAPMLGMELPQQAPPTPRGADGYRVLARKYRPQTFAELIGQDAMVRTLANAIERGRLAHAFLMTGVRGVGKTSTARLIAKGLNCIGADGTGGPTTDPCGVCEPCRAIAEGRHIDIIEIDAASHTGIDNVREVIIEAARYSAVSARYKVYIVDEVHQLSKAAFNALLKTLEEPPPHVKFILATTEVQKVPVTVLSRCQRFDLRRVSPETLAEHFARICVAEHVAIDDEALRLIALAAEGSVRDGLSLLDQAIAHADSAGDGEVQGAAVQAMLGLADTRATRRLFARLIAADGAGTLQAARQLYEDGADPTAIMRSLLGFTHAVTLRRVSGTDDPAQPGDAQAAIAEFAGSLSIGRLQRLWQILLRGMSEVREAADPLPTLEMALLRVVHAASLPDPDALAALLSGQGAALALPPTPSAPTPPPMPAEPPTAAEPTSDAQPTQRSAEPQARPTEPTPPPSRPAPPPGPDNFALMVDALGQAGALVRASNLRRSGRVVAYDPAGHLELQRHDRFTDADASELQGDLRRSFGPHWKVSLSDTPGAPTLAEAAQAAEDARLAEIRAHPVVSALTEAFPDAEIAAPSTDPD